MKYLLSDALCVYTSDNEIQIIKGQSGEIYHFRYTESFLRLLQLMRSPKTFEELHQSLQSVSMESLNGILQQLKNMGLIDIESTLTRDIRVMLIGLGSLGSHIFTHLSMLPLQSLLIVDDDTVDETNLFRQVFFMEDYGKDKTDVLISRPTLIQQVEAVNTVIQSSSNIDKLLDVYQCNLVIQAGDRPSTGELAMMICDAAEQRSLPYIINPGYIGGAVVFPEFYFSGRAYTYRSSHHSWNSHLIFQHQRDKIPFRLCSEVGSVVAQQVEDYRCYREPIGYQKKGYFDYKQYRWVTVPVDDEGNEKGE